jgi:hypothetical protein
MFSHGGCSLKLFVSLLKIGVLKWFNESSQCEPVKLELCLGTLRTQKHYYKSTLCFGESSTVENTDTSIHNVFDPCKIIVHQ